MQRPRNFRVTNLYLLFIAIYPVLSLLGSNISEVPFQVVFRPLLFSLLLAAVLWGGIFLLIRNTSKAAMLAALILILFFSYGHFYNIVGGLKVQGILLGRQRNLIAVYLLVLVCGSYWILRQKTRINNLTGILNIVSVGMLVFPLFQSGDYMIRNDWAKRSLPGNALVVNAAATTTHANNLPDIYYIILDMYARDDVLKEEIKYNNNDFLEKLRQMGFYIGRCSLSNYGQTQLSLASSLNMDYLQNLGITDAKSVDRTSLDQMIQHSAVQANLEARGYKTISLAAYQPLKIENAAVTYSTDPKDLPAEADEPVVNQFEAMFIKSTAVLILTDLPQTSRLAVIRNINYPYADHIRQQRFILKTLKDIPSIPGPKFVFVHIQIPHPPLVFGPNGQIVEEPPPFPSDPARPVPAERVWQLYGDQVAFIDRQMLDILPSILNHPGTRPIVIIQGDHGPNVAQRTAVLNAYYLPAEMQAFLYPKITPVNSFRLILDHVFGMDLGLLKDASYNSSYEKPFLYEEMIETRDGCATGP